MTTQANEPTISLAAAADRLATNSNVVRRWIDAGRIQAVAGPKGELRILEAPFEKLCQEITSWLRQFSAPDDEGYARATVQEMEEFWKSYSA